MVGNIKTLLINGLEEGVYAIAKTYLTYDLSSSPVTTEQL